MGFVGLTLGLDNTMKGFIYKWTCKLDGKNYIGQTINERKRYLQHYNAERRDVQLIDRAIYKKGVENFEYAVIFTIHAETREELRKQLDFWEIIFIKVYQSHMSTGKGYNMTWGGMSRGSYNHSEETKIKLSKMKLGKKLSETAKRNIAAGHKGLKKSELHKAHIQAAHKADMKHVRQCTVNGVLVAEYESIKAAERKTGINRGGISACINGRQQRTTGRDGVSYTWKLN